MTAPVSGFAGDYRWLSNFWPAQVLLGGETYPTVEHAYQAAKTVDENERAMIRGCRKPGDAKRAGRTVTKRSDWEAIKVDAMLCLLTQKFSRSPLREQLEATGGAELIEDNVWGDVFWGVCRGVGENRLGKLLMQIRAENRVPR